MPRRFTSPAIRRAENVYGRYGNPTWRAYEEALGELEGGEVVLFASGMAAATAVLLTALSPAGALVLPSDCYMHVRGLAEGHLAERGVHVHWRGDAVPEGFVRLSAGCEDPEDLLQDVERALDFSM